MDDADAMLAYLWAKGVVGLPPTATCPVGMSDGWTAREKGRHLPATRISQRMSHVGVRVGEFEASMRFYGEILGFKEIWRGSAGGKTLNWVNMRVPDGEDYVEFMLYETYPTTDRLHTMHHICLEVPDIEKAAAMLATRIYPAGSKPATPMKVGVNGKRQINFYDVDGTRVEIMGPSTAPPSRAMPP